MTYRFKTVPFQHQANVLARCWEHTNWALFLEMGTGKSKICIDNVGLLYEEGRINTFVVVAPKGVYRNWAKQELPKHLPDRIPQTMVIWNPTPTKAQKNALKSILEPSDSLRIFIVNVEALSTVKGQRFLEQLLKNSEALLAIDESTTIKSPKARRTKAIIRIGELAKYRRILTGSPVTQSPLDLWAQCRFLGKDLLGDVGDNFYQFQYRYAIIKRRQLGSHSFNLVVGYRDLDNLARHLKSFSSRIRKDECLDLPPKIYTQRNIALSDDQARIYNELREFALARIDDDEFMTVDNVMTQLLRMQQVLSGHTKTDGGDLIDIKDNRLDELLACLEESEGKAIIWSRFRYDVKRISQALIKRHGAESTVTYFGDTSDEERTQGIERFQNGNARFFVGNPQTGGYGITLTAAQNVIYFSNSFDLAVRMQSEDRAHRIGQNKSVTYVDFIAEGTIDERIVEALRNKMDIASEVLGENLRKWLTK
ncbi:MAG: Superfamily II DNA or RNA helicase, SNF2 family [Chloroflexi bacterium]|jgi:SNF2 family DNA or RNA helicase|nr:MAG: Superfamily II DNA or RNA helicase, SNF2 family [Chloroflexota bacterium]